LYSRGLISPAVMDGAKVLAYKLSDLYTYPEPELVPCRCGGEAKYSLLGKGWHYLRCSDCGVVCQHTSYNKVVRIWNAANKPEPIPYPEMSNAFRRCVDEPLSESEMPETVFLTDIKTGQSRFQLGDYSTTADDVYKHEYRKEKTCTVKFNKSSTISGPTWTCAECGYNRVLENNTHCGNCGAKIEREAAE